MPTPETRHARRPGRARRSRAQARRAAHTGLCPRRFCTRSRREPETPPAVRSPAV